ncbi:MAG TPA: hypothetical protein VGO90_14580 [Chthoniobacteraceae bacterium]|jgi:hypothetical protein|nr:hypothetical protein [Chthoniobacteraceae bacterium]
MHLIQILLPLFDNAGQRLPQELYRQVSAHLTERFGGLTAFTRAPAEGLWQEGDEDTTRDEIVIYEVLAETLDTDWWSAYRAELETQFRQERIIIRAQETQLL